MKISEKKLKKIIREEFEDAIPDDFGDGNRGKYGGEGMPQTELHDPPLKELDERWLEVEQHPDTHTILVSYAESMKAELQDKFPSKREVLEYVKQLATKREPVKYHQDISYLFIYPPPHVYDENFLQNFMDQLTRNYPGTEFSPVWMFDYQR